MLQVQKSKPVGSEEEFLIYGSNPAPSGSEEEDILNIFLYVTVLQTHEQWGCQFCFACAAEARHMYCFSGVVVVVGVVIGGVNFCRVFAFMSFSQKI